MSRLLLAVVLLLAGLAPARAGDRLALIGERGVIIVGVKADYPPFGMVDAGGRLVGIEPDLAADLARRLGVGLRLVAVTSANRLQKLEDGSVDAVIATLGDTAERRSVATLVEPPYFAGGANVMLRPDARDVVSWDDLRGREVCATLGAQWNPAMARRYLLDLRVFKDNRDATMALHDGRCVGWLYDDVAVQAELRKPAWQGYRMVLPSALATPWAVALARSEAGGPLERAVSDSIATWHREGVLLATTRRWGIPESDFLRQQQALWTAVGPDGQPLCRRQDDDRWPAECRQESRWMVEDVGGLVRVALLIRERTGLDLSFLRRPHEQLQLLRGLAYTLALIGLAILGSLAVGLGGALVVASRWRTPARLIEALATFLRMTPPLLQIYVLYFSAGGWLRLGRDSLVEAFGVAVLCLALYAGAANIAALGEPIRLWRRGQLAPGAGWREVLRLAWPALTASCVNIAKATGMASTIAVPELVQATSSIVAQNGNPGVMMNLLMVTYFLLILLVVRAFARIGRRLAGR